jgi:hypothetical protein
LLKSNAEDGGTFSASAGEVVYIGHFYLDCLKEPLLWRYYLQGADSFNKYLSEYKEAIPELNVANTKFRLFKTKFLGEDYELK